MKIRNGQAGPFPVSSIGHLAHLALLPGTRGTVAAVFERSAYLCLSGSYVCLGVDSLGKGPLNVTTGIPVELWKSLEFDRDMPAEIVPGSIRVGGKCLFEITEVPVWSPPQAAKPTWRSVDIGLRTLEEAARTMVPTEGLGGYLFVRDRSERGTNPVYNFAMVPVQKLKCWLEYVLLSPCEGDTPDPSSWYDLIGLGPGLTPSGDDLLCGALLTLHQLGESETAKRLFRPSELELSRRTHAISAAHLKAAAAGMGSEKIHAVLNAVLSGRNSRCRELLEDVGNVGHTSGWDALAGMAIVCRAWINSEKHQQNPEVH
jgi:hypothetical protein